MLNNYLTNNMKKAINESIIVMGSKTLAKRGSPAVIVAFFIPAVQVGFIIHYVGRAKNTTALVVNNSGLSFCGLFDLPTLLIIVQSIKKDTKQMKTPNNRTTPSSNYTIEKTFNHNNLSHLALADLFEDLLLNVKSIANIICADQDIQAQDICSMLDCIINSTQYKIHQEHGYDYQVATTKGE